MSGGGGSKRSHNWAILLVVSSTVSSAVQGLEDKRGRFCLSVGRKMGDWIILSGMRPLCGVGEFWREVRRKWWSFKGRGETWVYGV